ncbi:WD40-repeat-containing domain protein [Fimicolochytrium jonesii]|uniref:WD40-repeat-containing domain protein n=1 Tax=Fimicolochytrium jonesii TaxID=1396493 RepID=UPI0022FF1ADB|nr:WD40-repeat-containing domain protein [Fimicolochytrium jonesii]KAI8815889.1 WD40-repeat-containing domain protein [Fimicolochytrium jonesii]
MSASAADGAGAHLQRTDGQTAHSNHTAETPNGTHDSSSTIASAGTTHSASSSYSTSGMVSERKGHEASIAAVVVVDGKMYSAGKDKIIQEWDGETFEPLRALKGHDRWIRALAAGHQQLFSGSWDETIRIWSLESGECTHILQSGPTQALYYDESSARLYSGGAESATVYEWDSKSGALVDELDPAPPEADARSRSMDGVTCMTGDAMRLFVGMTSGNIEVFSVQTATWAGTFRGHVAEVTDLTVWKSSESHSTPDGTGILFSSGHDQVVLEWAIGTSQLVRRFEGHNSYVSALCVLPMSSTDLRMKAPPRGKSETASIDANGDPKTDQPADHHEPAPPRHRHDSVKPKLVSAGWDGALRLWDLRTGSLEGFVERGHRLSINAVVPLGRNRIMTAGADGLVKVWSLETLPAPPPQFRATASPVHGAFHYLISDDLPYTSDAQTSQYYTAPEQQGGYAPQDFQQQGYQQYTRQSQQQRPQSYRPNGVNQQLQAQQQQRSYNNQQPPQAQRRRRGSQTSNPGNGSSNSSKPYRNGEPIPIMPNPSPVFHNLYTPFQPAPSQYLPVQSINPAAYTIPPRPPPIQTTAPTRAICTFFLQGRCRYGDDCRYAHVAPAPSPGQMSPVSPQQGMMMMMVVPQSPHMIHQSPLTPGAAMQVPTSPIMVPGGPPLSPMQNPQVPHAWAWR